MKTTPCMRLESSRRTHPVMGRSPSGAMWGYFEIVRPSGILRIVSSGERHGGSIDDRGSWEHVSISLATRTPTWEEMALVKTLFWTDEETVIQYHPPRSQYVNRMQHCLHLWKPPFAVALPPRITMDIAELA